MPELTDQINLDQKRYSRYVCDSRAIPHLIDGLKPVQRRILWSMWQTSAKEHFTKTVKAAGLVMGFHPHGDSSIQDAMSQMTQDFTFANNYNLIEGEGTFGDVLDPKAIASPRYTEVRLSQFSKDVGLFESIPDLDFVPNYDATSKEPLCFVPKLPTILLNPILGIATGFSCNMQGHNLGDVADAVIEHLEGRSTPKLTPWYKGYKGPSTYETGENGAPCYTTGFGFERRQKSLYLTSAPQGWNREKVIQYLESVVADEENPIRSYTDHSRDRFDIEIFAKRGTALTPSLLRSIFTKVNREFLVPNVITPEGRLTQSSNEDIVKSFAEHRTKHLKRRFNRLAGLEREVIEKHEELIRFIREEWHVKLVGFSNKKELETKLSTAKFVHVSWLADLPVYRMTQDEVAKSRKAIQKARRKYSTYQKYLTQPKALTNFMVDEINELKHKWGSAK